MKKINNARQTAEVVFIISLTYNNKIKLHISIEIAYNIINKPF